MDSVALNHVVVRVLGGGFGEGVKERERKAISGHLEGKTAVETRVDFAKTRGTAAWSWFSATRVAR